MHVIRAGQAPQYAAIAHHGVTAFRLHGRDVTPSPHFWVGLSDFAPGGGAEIGSSPTEKVYLLLEGSLTIVTGDGEVVLGPMDSCLIEPNETRTIENRSGALARMLVVSPS